MARKKVAQKPQDAVLGDLIASVNDLYPDAVKVASDPSLAVTRWATGVRPIDDLLDGGIPKGRSIEVYGSYSVLKSYWAYRSLAAVQQQGGKVALVDTEHAWDEAWGTALGIDASQMLVAWPKTAENAIGIMEALVRQKYDLVVLDSIAASLPKQHQESMPGDDNQPGALARVMSKGLARLTAANTHTSLLFINQTRSTIGITFGPKSTTSGGKAMAFYASYRLSFVRTGKITEKVKQWDGENYVDGRKVIAHKILATLEKSKLSAPYSDAHFLYDLRTGQVDVTNYLVGKAMESGVVVRKSGGWYAIPGVLDEPIQGADTFRSWLDDNPEVIDYLGEEA